MDIAELMESTTPEPKDLMLQDDSLDRKKARSLVQNIVREKELDIEATLPSGDQHLSKLINRPIADAIRHLEDRNKTLIEMLANNTYMSDLTPQEISKELTVNMETLLNIKKSITPKESSGASLTLDLGSVFKQAADSAREAIQNESSVKEIISESTN
jgi:hypothetical protein